MKKAIPLLLSAVLLVGCAGGDTIIPGSSGGHTGTESAGDGPSSVAIADPDADYVLPRPDPMNLDFWLTEDVSGADQSVYEYHPGFGGYTLYGKGYVSKKDADGAVLEEPDPYVEYNISGYPDVLDEYVVTLIFITDPAVEVYGLTVDTPVDEFERIMTDLGFSRVETDVQGRYTYKRGKTEVTLFRQYDYAYLMFGLEITNKEQVVF